MATASTTPFNTKQSKLQHNLHLFLLVLPFLDSLMTIFIDIVTTIGSITEDLDPINHTLPEAEVGVAYTNNYQGQFHTGNNRYQCIGRFH